MSKAHVVAFDMGTTHIKSVLVDEAGQVAAQGKGKVKAFFPQDSWVEVDPAEWWDAICTITQSMLEQSGVAKEDVKGLIVASAACGVTAVDENHEPLRRSIVWLDNRASNEAEMVMDAFGGRAAFMEQTGMLLCGKDAVIKHLWMKINENELYESAKYLLDDAGYVMLRATGECVCSRQNASAIALDFENGQWDHSLMEALELDKAKYPPLVNTSDIVGGLTEKAAKELGLLPGTPVFGGCTDMQGIELGSGCSKPGDSYFYLGTSGLIGALCDTPQPASAAAVPLASAVPEGVFMMGTSEMTGGCVDWALENLFRHEHETLGHSQLYDMAEEVLDRTAPGAENLFFANWLYGERNPMQDEWARASFVNLSVTHTREHMLRAVYEGTAYQMVWIVDEIERLHGLPMERLRLSGGGALSRNWMQIIANISNRPVDVVKDTQMSVVKGAAYAALVGLGMLPGFHAISDFVEIESTYLPQPEHRETYRKGMEHYISIYGCLKDLFTRVNGAK